MKRKQRSSAQRITLLAIFLAIIILQNTIPVLGYIPIPPLYPTIVHVTVIVASVVLGWKDGAIVGLAWGLIRWIKAWTAPLTPLDPIIWINPMISVLPRILVGIFSGWCYQMARQRLSFRWASSLAAVIGSLTNTILVLTFIVLFYGEIYAQHLGVATSALAGIIMMTIATSGLLEALIAALLTNIIAQPLLKKMNQL